MGGLFLEKVNHVRFFEKVNPPPVSAEGEFARQERARIGMVKLISALDERCQINVTLRDHQVVEAPFPLRRGGILIQKLHHGEQALP